MLTEELLIVSEIPITTCLNLYCMCYLVYRCVLIWRAGLLYHEGSNDRIISKFIFLWLWAFTTIFQLIIIFVKDRDGNFIWFR